MPILLPIGRKALPHPRFQLRWLGNIHQTTQFNISQPNSMTLQSIAASDLRIMIGSAHSSISSYFSTFLPRMRLIQNTVSDIPRPEQYLLSFLDHVVR
jgi:hypothetical protein